ncbi:MAG: enoyl-CoA hydratase/isomerase family protein [Ilumatobacteraceae bacterium]
MPVPTFDTLRITVDAGDPIATLELHRPDKLNALSRRLLAEVVEACEWFDRQGDLKVVVVRGAGRSFSAGFDLGDFADPDPDLSPRDAADLGRLATEALTDVGQLTVAAVHGHCVGGGVVLAAACDLRLAADDTRFSIPEVDLGIPLAWGGIPRLVREIGPALTKELVLTCRPFDAAEALSIGLVNRIVPAGADGPAAVHDAAEALARELAGKAAYSLRTTKQQVNAATEEMIGTRRNAADADALVVALGDAESRDVSRRYLEQRTRQPTSVDNRSS